MTKLDQIQELYRQDFTSFIDFAFRELYPNKTLEPSWHINCLGYHLQQAFFGYEAKLIFNLPPRTLKSMITSVAFTAWILGKNPQAQILCVHASLALGKQLEEMTRRLMITKRYRNLFPHVAVKNTQTNILLTEGGFRQSAACLTSMIGLSADFIIMDDMMSTTATAHDKLRKKIQRYYTDSIATRLNDKNKSVQVLCAQRLHEQDMSEFLLSNNDDWKHIAIPIISKVATTYQIAINQTHSTQVDEILRPSVNKRQDLKAEMLRMGGASFMAQYQQQPMTQQEQWGTTVFSDKDPNDMIFEISTFTAEDKTLRDVFDEDSRRPGGSYTPIGCRRAG